MIEITDKPIRPQDFIDKVSREHNGAITVFMGTVRDFADDRRLSHMEYDAYGEMAEKTLSDIVEEAKARWHTQEIVLAHRVGRVELKDISVIIAVGTPHRAQAFEACRYIIDRIKEKAPIWKKEVDSEGRGEWVKGQVPAASG
ncbi:MAG: molybdenum cofactor biosynthesis protein MoaE [Dehalococcoidia bacterium]